VQDVVSDMNDESSVEEDVISRLNRTLVPNDVSSNIRDKFKDNKKTISNLAIESKGLQTAIPPNKAQIILQILRTFIEPEVTAAVRRECNLFNTVSVIMKDEIFRFEADIKDYAQWILEEWNQQAAAVIAAAPPPPPAANANAPVVPALAHANAPPGTRARNGGPPPANHAIYGNAGIMRGIILRINSSPSYSLNKAFARSKIDRFGNKGFAVRDWWPLQVAPRDPSA